MMQFIVGDLFDVDELLLAIVLDNAGDGTVLGAGSDVLMELLVRGLVEEVEDIFFGFFVLDDDKGFALVGFATLAFVATDLALEDNFRFVGFLVLGKVGIGGDEQAGADEREGSDCGTHS
jgi:hypothetical protein